MAKDLIIVRAGRRSLHHTWLDSNVPRSWELLVCPYEEIPGPPPGIDGLMVSDVVIAPAKFAALTALLNDWREWRDYRYVMLVDDDIFGTQQTWSLFFDRCAQYGARLAQPALLENSYFSHSVTVRNTEFVARRTSFVETMMPCFRTDIFPEMLATFALSESGFGWGLDFLWAKKLNYKDIFVIDDAPVLHVQSSADNRDADLHRKLNEEMSKIMQENEVPWFMKTFSGFLPSGEEIAEGNPAFLRFLLQGNEEMFAHDPRRFHEALRVQLASPKT